MVSSGAKTKLRCFQLVKAAQFLNPLIRRSDSGDRQRRMYTQSLPICIPGPALAVSAARSAPIHSHESSRLLAEGAAPLGFCYGGFSSTAGYVSGNDAQAVRLERLRSPAAVPSRGALPVFIRALEKVCRLPLAGLSASTWRVVEVPDA